VLAGKCNEPAEARYLDETIRPLLGSDVELIRNADRPTVLDLLADARCLIMPIRWPEPFGMVMIEAMASGTPVVALRRGSVPEVVRDGLTGWICEHPADLPAALQRANELDPTAGATHVRLAFSAELMARRYERVYHQVIAAHTTRAPQPSALVRVLNLEHRKHGRWPALSGRSRSARSGPPPRR
jgi:glycosyltransferase involved in cell wall biosynthesis